MLKSVCPGVLPNIYLVNSIFFSTMTPKNISEVPFRVFITSVPTENVNKTSKRLSLVTDPLLYQFLFTPLLSQLLTVGSCMDTICLSCYQLELCLNATIESKCDDITVVAAHDDRSHVDHTHAHSPKPTVLLKC